MAVNRVTGLSSFDVEGMVTQLMKAETVKLTKVQQDKQYKIWEQEAYRSISDQMISMKNTYFDVLKPDSNLRSDSLFSQFSTAVTVNGATSTKVTVTGNAALQNFNQKIDYITQLATKDTYRSETLNVDALLSKDLVTDFASNKPAIFKATMAIGSSSKSIEIDMTGITDLTGFKNAMNAQITTQFGANYANVATVDGNQLKLRSAGNNVTFLAQTGSEASLSWIGIASGSSSGGNKNQPISALFGINESDLSTMEINGKTLQDMGVLVTDSLTKMSQRVNAAGVGVNLYYDSLKDQLSVTSTITGTANQLSLSNDFANKFKLTGGNHETAQNAIFSLSGVEIIKSENTFTIDGATITLNDTQAAVDGAIDMKFEVNTDTIKAKIKGFIDVYNGLIDSVYGKTKEKFYREFTPLTDEQKSSMTEEQVKQWESKSKSGVLRNHTDLENIMTRLRQAFSDTVEGSGFTLAQMGIETSSDFRTNGKLVITDEQKLDTALKNNYSDVVKLFSSESDKNYLDGANSAERYRENGIGNRLYDIIQDAVRTTRDSGGKKGILLEAAGISGDLSDSTSSISLKIAEYDNRIATLLDYLDTKETSYYNKFSKVEAALAKLESQSSSIMSQLGG